MGDFVFDFDDGTFQGWTKKGQFLGSLSNPGVNGNPGGFLLAEDEAAGGGGLAVSAPSPFTGNLARFNGIRWDEYVYVRGAGGSRVVRPTNIFIQGGTNGSIYGLADNPLTQIGVWKTRFVGFDPSSFALVQGIDQFDDVITSVSEVWFELDTSTLASGPESGIDNIRLVAVPEPSSILMVGSCLAFALGRHHRCVRKRNLCK